MIWIGNFLVEEQDHYIILRVYDPQEMNWLQLKLRKHGPESIYILAENIYSGLISIEDVKSLIKYGIGQ